MFFIQVKKREIKSVGKEGVTDDLKLVMSNNTRKQIQPVQLEAEHEAHYETDREE